MRETCEHKQISIIDALPFHIGSVTSMLSLGALHVCPSFGRMVLVFVDLIMVVYRVPITIPIFFQVFLNILNLFYIFGGP